MARKWMGAAVVALALVAAVGTVSAAPGDPDTTFSGDGVVQTQLSTGQDAGLGIAVQDDGKIVVVGVSARRFFAARYQANGLLDPTFSGDGKAFVDLTSGDDVALDVAIQEDGKIVLAGHAGNATQVALVRLNANGSLDTTFSGDGKLLRNHRSGQTQEVAFGVTLTAEQRIRLAAAIGGTAYVLGITPTGTIDSTFGPLANGQRALVLPGGPSFAADIATVGNDLVVAGSIRRSGPAAERTLLARLWLNGYDSDWGDEGFRIVNVAPGYEDATGVAVDDDGSTVTVGEANGQISVLRFTPDGDLDTTFSGDGIYLLPLPFSGEYGTGIDLQENGSIVVSGRMGGGGGRAVIARVTADGVLDPTFSGNGWHAFDLSTRWDGAYDVALQGDGAVVASGGANDDAKLAVFRLEGDPQS